MKKWLALMLGLCCVAINLWAAAKELRAIQRKITINGREANVFGLAQPDGTLGLRFKQGEPFDVVLRDTLEVPTSVHWHGLILPNNQDGVAFITQFPLYPGTSYRYHFPLVQTGTFWMHSHVGFQEQQLLSAPLIIEGDDDAQLADQEVVLFLADFSFKSPETIFHGLLCQEYRKFKHESK
jgi:FtsP/CotA-like multicopper oxidase with cupredoxin domain